MTPVVEPSGLVGLLARVEAATGADREIDFALHQIDMGDWLASNGYSRKGDGYWSITPPIRGANYCCGPEYYTASLDAALALCERVLPEADPKLWKFRFSGWGARLSAYNYSEYTLASHSYSKTPALALLAAMLKALISKERGNAG